MDLRNVGTLTFNFHPEDGESIDLRNVGMLSQHYTVVDLDTNFGHIHLSLKRKVTV
jgi:hypothetical protein